MINKKNIKRQIYEKFKDYKGDHIIYSILKSYYNEPMNIKKGLVSKGIVYNNDTILLKIANGMNNMNEDFINLINYTSIGNIINIINYCPTKKIVKKYKKILDHILDNISSIIIEKNKKKFEEKILINNYLNLEI